MRNLVRRLGVGRLALWCWHRPVGALRDSIRAGGPFQQRRTTHGRTEMEQAARTLSPLPVSAGRPVALHLLTGARFWGQTAFCLWTFARQAARPLAPVIYDDGSLRPEHRDALARLFPATRFVLMDETRARLDALLPLARYPFLRDRWQHYPNIRKLTDPHLGSTGWKLVLDSDLLFFRPPSLLLGWHDAPAAPLHAVDCETSYGYSRALLERLTGTPLAERVNVGLCGLCSGELDWDRLEFYCRELITAERPHYFLEQALVAMLVAGRTCVVAPADDYLTLPRPPEALLCRAVMHHYVAESKRWYFQRNWHRVLET